MVDYLVAYLNDEMSLALALESVRRKMNERGLSDSEYAVYREQNEWLQFHATIAYMESLGYKYDGFFTLSK